MTDPNPSKTLRQRAGDLGRTRAALDGAHQARRERYGQLQASLAEARTITESSADVSAILAEVQKRHQDRVVGAYERLLGLFLGEVIGRGIGVTLELGIERGLPALTPYVRKGANGPLEDALYGTGGSVKNLIVAGFRFVALMRSGKRPLLVLDEPDDWLREDYIPAFMGTIADVSAKLGVQVILISHHPDSTLGDAVPHRIVLEAGGGGVTAGWDGEEPAWGETQEGIRSLTLGNFQAHASTHIPLSPNVTLIRGDNHIGKTAVTRALKAVFYGEVNDSFIRHGAAGTHVVADFGPEGTLRWERRRKGSPKETFHWMDTEGNTVHHSEGAKTPAWLSKLGISNDDGFSTQLSNQDDDLFFLRRTPAERARMIAIGDDFSYIQKMIALEKSTLADARADIRSGEKELESLHRRITAYAETAGDNPAERITSLLDEGDEARNSHTAGLALKTRWESTTEKVAQLAQTRNLPEPPPIAEPPSRTPVTLAGRWARRLPADRMHMPAQADTQGAQPPDTRKDLELAGRWNRAQNRLRATGSLQDGTPINIAQAPGANESALAGRWRRARRANLRLPESRSPEAVSAPPDMRALRTLGKRWIRAGRVAHLNLGGAPDVHLMPPEGSGSARSLAGRWKKADEGSRERTQGIATAVSEAEKADRELNQSFPACPTCGQATEHTHTA